MSDIQLKSEQEQARPERGDGLLSPPGGRNKRRSRIRAVPVLVTLGTVALAARLSYAMWRAYVAAPWTRDGTVRVYVVTLAPEVAGRIVELPVADNQFVRKGDLLMVIDPDQLRDRRPSSRGGRAASQRDREERTRAQSERRRKQTTLPVSEEEQQIFASNAQSANASPISWPWPISTRRGQTSNAHDPVPGRWLRDQLADAARRLRQLSGTRDLRGQSELFLGRWLFRRDQSQHDPRGRPGNASS